MDKGILEEQLNKRYIHHDSPVLTFKHQHYLQHGESNTHHNILRSLPNYLSKITTRTDLRPLDPNNSNLSISGQLDLSRTLSSKLKLGLAKSDQISQD